MADQRGGRRRGGRPALEVVVVSGLSGAGRSTAAKCLEDLGYFVVDNLPPELIAADGRPRQPHVRRRSPGSRSWSTCAAGPSPPTCGRVIGDLDRARVPSAGAVPGGLRRGAGAPVRERPPGPPAAGRPAGWSTASPPSGSCCATCTGWPTWWSTPATCPCTTCAGEIEHAFGGEATAAAAGDRAVLRLQVRPAAGRRPGRGRALPAQPALDPGAAPAHRAGPRRPRLRAVPGRAPASSSTSTPSCCGWSAPATSGRASAT